MVKSITIEEYNLIVGPTYIHNVLNLSWSFILWWTIVLCILSYKAPTSTTPHPIAKTKLAPSGSSFSLYIGIVTRYKECWIRVILITTIRVSTSADSLLVSTITDHGITAMQMQYRWCLRRDYVKAQFYCQ